MYRQFHHPLLVLGGLLLTASASAQTYDATSSYIAGWNAHSNPNGVWKYGYSTTLTSTLNLYTTTATSGINGGNELFWYSPSIATGFDPSVAINNGPALDNGNINFLANELVLTGNPGTNGYSHVVFTAPSSSNYLITAGFRNDQHNTTTNGYFLANNSLLSSGSVSNVGDTVNYSGTISLLAGQTIDFAENNPGFSNTGFSATIMAVTTPEPGNIALLAGIVVSGAAFVRRRERQ